MAELWVQAKARRVDVAVGIFLALLDNVLHIRLQPLR